MHYPQQHNENNTQTLTKVILKWFRLDLLLIYFIHLNMLILAKYKFSSINAKCNCFAIQIKIFILKRLNVCVLNISY